MAALNPLTRELVFKLVFYGPGLGGKTTTLQYIYAATKPEHRGKMVSLATPTDRTLYFDYLPLRVPRVRGMSVRLQLFTVPGQVHFEATRKLVLSGADGVVFVADSQMGRVEANRESLEDLSDNLWEHNRKLAEMPHTFHWNKRDLGDLMSVEELEKTFNPHGAPSLETVATRGDGVFLGLERITRLVLRAYEADLPRSEVPAPEFGAEMGIEDAIRSLTAPPVVLTPNAEAPRSLTMPWNPHLMQRPGVAKEAAPEMAEMASMAGPSVARSPESPPPRPLIEDAHDKTVTAPKALSHRPLPKIEIPDVDDVSAVNDVSAVDDARAVDDVRAVNDVSAANDVSDVSDVNVVNDVSVVIDVNDVNVVNVVDEEAPLVGFSMAEMWPESDRESVRRAEMLIAGNDAINAVLACDVIVTRILASAAAMAGSAEAPRDPGVVALLLGLTGVRFLAFRAAVRAARQRQAVSMRDAYESYALAIEARHARDAIGR